MKSLTCYLDCFRFDVEEDHQKLMKTQRTKSNVLKVFKELVIGK